MSGGVRGGGATPPPTRFEGNSAGQDAHCPAAWLHRWLQPWRPGADPRPSASGRAYPQLAQIVRELCAVAGRRCLPLVVAVAVTVAVSSAALGSSELRDLPAPTRSLVLRVAGFVPRIFRIMVTACAVQGMARVRSGQARARPLVLAGVPVVVSGVKRDLACPFTRHLACARCPAVTVALDAGGAGTYTSQAIPGSESSQDFAASGLPVDCLAHPACPCGLCLGVWAVSRGRTTSVSAVPAMDSSSRRRERSTVVPG